MRLPVMFLGHGSPMNAIEDNPFTNEWKKIGKAYKPKYILVISAHWVTDGVKVTSNNIQRKLNDMSGFPQELYDLKYPVYGSEELVERLKILVKAKSDDTWGLDHGSWSILVHMYPNANIPVVQLSIDKNLTAKDYYKLGQKLKPLRDEQVLVIGSGNVVHNLNEIYHGVSRYKWCEEFDEIIKRDIQGKKFIEVVNYETLGEIADKSVPTPEHFVPLLFILGMVDDDVVQVFNENFCFGSISMTSYIFGK